MDRNRGHGTHSSSQVHVRRESAGTRVVQSRTIPLPEGRSADAKAESTADPRIGNSPARSGPASLKARRLCRVSATRRMTMSLPSSRRFRATRRVHAWTSRMCDSASTGTLHPRPEMTASQARRSPATPRGTSVPHLSCTGRRIRSLDRRASCAASRIGSPSGKARSVTSSPRTAPITASDSYGTRDAVARSMRLISECEIPTVRAT